MNLKSSPLPSFIPGPPCSPDESILMSSINASTRSSEVSTSSSDRSHEMYSNGGQVRQCSAAVRTRRSLSEDGDAETDLSRDCSGVDLWSSDSASSAGNRSSLDSFVNSGVSPHEGETLASISFSTAVSSCGEASAGPSLVPDLSRLALLMRMRSLRDSFLRWPCLPRPPRTSKPLAAVEAADTSALVRCGFCLRLLPCFFVSSLPIAMAECPAGGRNATLRFFLGNSRGMNQTVAHTATRPSTMPSATLQCTSASITVTCSPS
mmetsp:Transcript_23761/g.53938  ORF Transcript_23761/g.53938 Transcript_23761/m.53938 type:complete len:264 (-) Transcript_23761:27-818(-)